jgi:arylsulfatase A-like enzyme
VRIGKYYWESEPSWPEDPRAPAGAPNVLLVVLDDVGFAQIGCFGSDVATPNIDALAARGLRYSSFHTTALCSPTRAAVLTGCNHHRVGMGRIVDLAMGFPGYTARIPADKAMLPAMLTPHGYAAYAVGKWHLTPEDEEHLGATRVRWPLGKGFERWYGFFPGETHQFVPALMHDNHAVDPPSTYEDGYHLTADLIDKSIEFLEDLRNVDVDKPWCLYLATGACHSPHQTPPGWIERYAGHFDAGWDAWRDATLARQKAMGVVPEHTVLSERPEWVPPWSSLSEQERRVYARYMEAFAAYLSHTDHELGRLLERLNDLGELDNTMVIVLSDNGASSEGGLTGSLNDGRVWNALPRTVEEADERLDDIGGPRIHNNYPWGWTVAGNTPFRRWKRETHEGGVADPLIVAWPRGIDARGEVRTQYVHAIDVLPTVLDAIGVAPANEIDGFSFASTFGSADAAEVHTTQYYEMLGCRALYEDGWKAVTYHEVQFDEPGLDKAPWELYDLRADPSETRDLAAAEPDRLARMIDTWWKEAEANNVLPVDNRPFSEMVFNRPSSVAPRNRYRYYPGRAPVPESVAANVRNRPFIVTAHVTLDGDALPNGVLVAQGSVLGGWSFHAVAGELVYVHNLAGWRLYRVAAPLPGLSAGEHTLGMDFEAPGVSLLVDGEVIGEGVVKRTLWSRFSLTGAGLTAGWSPDYSPADEDYRGRFAFTGGTLHHVDIAVPGAPQIDPEAEVQDIVASQ